MASFLRRLSAQPVVARTAIRHRALHHQPQGNLVQGIAMSPLMIRKVTRGILNDIDLIVYDMAGTTVHEGGIVYKTLRQSMVQDGLDVSEEEIAPWHGAKKEAVIEHFARVKGTPEHEVTDRVVRCGEWFINAIDKAYFDEAAAIDHINVGLLGYFRQLQAAGVKIGLDTGYPANIQKGLVEKLGFDKVVDGYISSYDVQEGRPYPYMVHRLMERLRIEDVRRVAKVGDSCRDIEEGRNAGCGLVVGVLSGADDYDSLMAAGADIVCNCVTDLPVPVQRGAATSSRLPDLS